MWRILIVQGVTSKITLENKGPGLLRKQRINQQQNETMQQKHPTYICNIEYWVNNYTFSEEEAQWPTLETGFVQN